jgi:hypothetical protein
MTPGGGDGGKGGGEVRPPIRVRTSEMCAFWREEGGGLAMESRGFRSWQWR